MQYLQILFLILFVFFYIFYIICIILILFAIQPIFAKYSQYFANIGCAVARKLYAASKDAWKKYEVGPQTNSEQSWDLKPVDCETVRGIILHPLKVNKAAGLDKIPARLIRDAEVELALSMTYLINKSIIDGTVPDVWKIARVSPLHKSDDKLLVENYRPISVLPVLSKVMERVIHAQLTVHLDQLGSCIGISMVLGEGAAPYRR